MVVSRTPSASEKTAPSHSPGTRGCVFGYRCAIRPHLWTWLLRAWTIRWPLHMSVVPSLAHAATSEDGACTPQSHSLSHRRAQRGCADNTHRAIWRWSQCWMHPQPQLSITLISKILFAECIFRCGYCAHPVPSSDAISVYGHTWIPPTSWHTPCPSSFRHSLALQPASLILVRTYVCITQPVLEKYDDIAIPPHCWNVVWPMPGCSGATFSETTLLQSTFRTILDGCLSLSFHAIRNA